MLNTSATYKTKVYEPVRKFRSRVTIDMEAFAKLYFSGFRYIRDWINGSSANANNYWNAIKVMSGSIDRAQGILPTSNTTLTNAVNITDGSNTTYGYSFAGNFYAQVDLGEIRTDVTSIQIIHYYLDGRTFYGGKVEISADGESWITLRDSAIDGTYVETSSGITLVPNQETVKTYDDNTIMSMRILEEMSTLNESLPSNELQLMMDNSNGDFDLLNFTNMQQIIASKPTIQTELGLLLVEADEETFISDYQNKISVSNTENPNFCGRYGAGPLRSPFTTWTELDNTDSLTGYPKLYTLNTSYAGQSAGAGVAGRRGQHLFAFDIISILERRYGSGIWINETELIEKVKIARTLLKRAEFNWWGYGTLGTAYGAFISIATTTGTWSTIKSHTNSTRTQLSIPTTSFDTFLANDGFMYFNAYSLESTSVDNSVIWTDYVELELEMNKIEQIEWQPTGKFFLTEWKNAITNKTITLIGNDYFALFSETSYTPTGITNLKSLATDVLTKGGVPLANQLIDNSLSAITVNNFPERLDIRTALQHIAIAGLSAVGQDRLGNIFIKPFKVLDEVSNYITYVTTQSSLYGYAGPTSYLLNDTGGGMKYLDFDQMYEPPQVSLEKSVYQLIVKVYATSEPTENVYTNTFIQGTSGQSFTIDNPLIKTNAQADDIADWYMREINYNARYSTKWRQNPALECADVILVEDSFSAEKQTRIIRQELNYTGYLEGITESRGGI